ncbi:MAG: hypothetical protein J5884_04085 [Paludibacteraceae bacterium]|nr:hypothetical protein [Paludibacteraceae bacterium]
MRKIFLSLFALCTAVAANAFTLRMQNVDASDPDRRNVDVTADENDVFGDGKVAVHFDSENKEIKVTFDNASLKGTNAQEVFRFEGDANYYSATVYLKGTNSIASSAGKCLYVQNGTLSFVAKSQNAVLNISGTSIIAQLQDNACLVLGSAYHEIFDVNITTSSSNQPVFYGAGVGIQSLQTGLANVNIQTTGNNQLTLDLEGVTTIGKLSNDVVIFGDKEFRKDGNPYKGNLTITSPYPVRIKYDYINPDNAADFKPAGLTNGKISYNPATKTLTLDDVQLNSDILIMTSDATVYCKNSNTISNPGKENLPRISLGENGKITGDEDAYLTIYCGGECSAIDADGNLEISGLKKLDTYAAANAIEGNASALENVLKIGCPMQLYCKEYAKPVYGFSNIIVSDPDLALSASSEVFVYNTSERAFVDKNDPAIYAEYIAYEYPTYLTFYEYPVNAKNMTDIKIAGAEGKASYDKATNKLTLNGFKETSIVPTVCIYGFKDNLNIVLMGTNEISASGNAIETNGFDITIEGPGSLKATSGYNAGIYVPEKKKLTISKSATVEVVGSDGVKSGATMTCNPGGMDPGDYELTGDASELEINNATLIAKTTEPYSYYAAIQGFKIPTLKDAKLVTKDARFAFECNMSDALAGVAINNEYAREATIEKTGSTAIENTSIHAIKGQKTIINGQLFILVGEHTYDAQGQMVH